MNKSMALFCLLALGTGGAAQSLAKKGDADGPTIAIRSSGRLVCELRYDGLGSPPKGSAVPFGLGVISTRETNQRVVAVDPRGEVLFFTLIGATGPQILESRYRNGGWQKPAVAPFSNIGINTEPSFSPDGRTLYFVSTRPPSQGTDIWKVERTSAGWGEPVRLGAPVNGAGLEWHPQATANGDLYFASDDPGRGIGDADLYVARFRDGAYLPAENLGPQINTSAAEWDGYVNPSGDYLIFKSNRPGGYGGLDIYISERSAAGWSAPRNLGPLINTAGDEDTGEVTPDGRYMTFARSTTEPKAWAMYWVDMKMVRPGRPVTPCAPR